MARFVGAIDSGTTSTRFMLFDERTVAAYRQAAEAIFGSET